jgi:hypothetical protein
MMSPTYWNLPKPNLIISVTGSADDFKEDDELRAHDVPFSLFRICLESKELSEDSEDLKDLKMLKKSKDSDLIRNVVVPVRKFLEPNKSKDQHEDDAKKSRRKDEYTSERDSLSDILYRISDNLAYVEINNTLSQFAEFLQKVVEKRAQELSWPKLIVTFKATAALQFSIKTSNLSSAPSLELRVNERETKIQNILPLPLEKLIVENVEKKPGKRASKSRCLGDYSFSVFEFRRASSDVIEFAVDFLTEDKSRKVCVKPSDKVENLKAAVATKMGVFSEQRLFIRIRSDGQSFAEDRPINFSGVSFTELEDGSTLEMVMASQSNPHVIEGIFVFVYEKNLFSQFIDKIHVYSEVTVEFCNILDLFSRPVAETAKSIHVLRLIEDSDFLKKSCSEQNAGATQNCFMDFRVPVLKIDEEISHIKRRIENLSLSPWFPKPTKEGEQTFVTEYLQDKNGKCCYTLPRPIGRHSTLILHRPKGQVLSEEQVLLDEDFKVFQKDTEEMCKECTLLRTQGTGCSMTEPIIQRILHQVSFLLPLSFGSIWIIHGGTNRGIMKVVSLPCR